MLEENEISQLPANSIPVTFGTHYIILSENGLQTIEPGAFTIFSEPGKSIRPLIMIHCNHVWYSIHNFNLFFAELNTIVLMVSQNALTTVDEEVFGTIMPYVREFRLKGMFAVSNFYDVDINTKINDPFISNKCCY